MSSLLALIVATAVLVIIPGPNVALIVANSLKFGFRMGVVTVLGTTAGVALQLALVVIGMAALIEFADSARTVFRRYSAWRNRLTGAFLAAAGVGLALARR